MILLTKTDPDTLKLPRADRVRLFLDEEGVLNTQDGAGHIEPIGGSGVPSITGTANVETRTDLAAIPSEPAVLLVEADRDGVFTYVDSDLSDMVAADTLQLMHVAPQGDDSGASGAWVRKAPSGDVQAEWAGKRGDNSHDDQPAIQAATDWQSYRFGSGVAGGKVLIGSGLSRLAAPLQLGWGDGFRNAVLQGAGVRYAGGAQFCGTALLCDYSEGYGIGISGARRTSIGDLSLIGQNRSWVATNALGTGTSELDELDPANWVSPAIQAAYDANGDGPGRARYAPYAGIVVDPRKGASPGAARQYPDLELPAWLPSASQYSHYPSSVVELDRIDVDGFDVGVVNSPNGDGNGEEVTLRGYHVANCRYGFSVGNTQARLQSIEGGSTTDCHTAITTGAHGQQLGKPAIRITSHEMSRVVQWLDVNTLSWGGGLNLTCCYGEQVYALGNAGNIPAQGVTPVRFQSCEIAFHAARGIPRQILSAQSNNAVTIAESVLSDESGGSRLNYHFIGDAAVWRFENVSIRAGLSTDKLWKAVAHNATMGITFNSLQTRLGEFSGRPNQIFDVVSPKSGGFVNFQDGSFSRETSVSRRSTGICVYARHVSSAEGVVYGDPGFPVRIPPYPFDKATCTSAAVNGREVTLNLTGSDIATTWIAMQVGGMVGDVLLDNATQTVFFIKSRTGATIVMEAQNNYDEDGELREGFSLAVSGVFYVLNCRLFTPWHILLSDTTAGSPIITNVHSPAGITNFNSASNGVQPGDAIWTHIGYSLTSPFPVAATVVSVADGTITMSQNAHTTQTGLRFGMWVRAPGENDA